MKIALISFEYPPAVAVGGIGTYAWHASHMLAASGVEVVVFAAGRKPGTEAPRDGITVHRLVADGRTAFAQALVPALLAAHADKPFAVIEAPEIGPEGGPAFTTLSSVARVVKLHTPSFLIGRYGYDATPAQRLRFFLGGLRRGRWAVLSPPAYDRTIDPEYQTARLADEIAAPSQAIGNILRHEWSLPPDKINVYPYPFVPGPALLSLPPPSRLRTVGFLGRLEPRKGVVEMVGAIPAILAKSPGLRFRFIGPSWPYARTDMRTWILRRYPRLAPFLEFTGAVTPEQVSVELGRCDALVLPSRWENFPFACWEAMASGRAVVGSASGGMAEVIEDGVSGLLVPPHSSPAIAKAVLHLADHPNRVAALGIAGRNQIATLLAPGNILPLQLASYRRAIQRASARNARA